MLRTRVKAVWQGSSRYAGRMTQDRTCVLIGPVGLPPVDSPDRGSSSFQEGEMDMRRTHPKGGPAMERQGTSAAARAAVVRARRDRRGDRSAGTRGREPGARRCRRAASVRRRVGVRQRAGTRAPVRHRRRRRPRLRVDQRRRLLRRPPELGRRAGVRLRRGRHARRDDRHRHRRELRHGPVRPRPRRQQRQRTTSSTWPT